MESGYRGQLEVKIKVLSCPLCSSPQHPLTTLCGKGSQVVTKVAKKPQTYPAEAVARQRVNKFDSKKDERRSLLRRSGDLLALRSTMFPFLPSINIILQVVLSVPFTTAVTQ